MTTSQRTGVRLDLNAARDDVDVRDWALDEPGGKDRDRVRRIRDEINERVRSLFDEIEADLSTTV